MTTTACPGCGLLLPVDADATYDGYFHASPECWAAFTGVQGMQLAEPALYGRARQLTVDAYAVQHAGGPHPDKSVDLHLAGLLFVLERDVPPTGVPPLLKRLADAVEPWPHFPSPERRGTLTIGDVARARPPDQHVAAVRQWAGEVWRSWTAYHADVAALVERNLGGRHSVHTKGRSP